MTSRLLKKAVYMEFKVNTEKLIDNVLSNIYKDELVYVRELVSNSIDAKASKINIKIFHEKNIVCFYDNGHGMDASDLEKYIGTIASSSKTNCETIG